MKILQRLQNSKLISPPYWLPENAHYVTEMGSVAYGCSGGGSDRDIYGFAIPPKNIVFPHTAGDIMGFGTRQPTFDQWQQHHIKDPDKDIEWDFQIYSIVRYFQLCMENNPNMLDSMFTPDRCVLKGTEVANMVRDKRKEFLSKLIWKKYRGYARSQLYKMTNKSPDGKRKALVEKFGYDVKFAYHIVRLMLEAEQILMYGDVDLECNSETFKSIRRGEWSEQEMREWFSAKTVSMETLYNSSKLRDEPDEKIIKQLLIDCLEHHYGNLSGVIVKQDEALIALRQIQEISNKYFLTNE